jgi:hypothetical protein
MISKMKIKSVLGLWLVFFLGVVGDYVFSQETAEGVYEAALLKEEAEGDLQGAIQLF